MNRSVSRVLALMLVAIAWVPAVHAVDYTFTTFDAPGSPSAFLGGTAAGGINNLGKIVGGFGTWSPRKSSSFLYDGKTFTIFDYPGTVPDGSTGATGINDAGKIVGSYSMDLNVNHGFLLADGTYTSLDVPGAQYSTVAADINNAGTIVGVYDYSSVPKVSHSFIYDGKTYTTFAHPDPQYTNTTASGINATGLIVGSVTDARGNTHGFLYEGGKFTILDFPGADQTAAVKINKSGVIVGFYTFNGINPLNSPRHGFIYANGTFSTLDVPFSNAKWTMLTGINDWGQLVGTWVDTSFVGHGFLAIPPIPPPKGGLTSILELLLLD